MDFTSIEETVPLHKEAVIRNVMVMQDHFSKYVVERSHNLDRSFRIFI